MTPAVITVLYNFPGLPFPRAALIQGSDGNLYGTAKAATSRTRRDVVRAAGKPIYRHVVDPRDGLCHVHAQSESSATTSLFGVEADGRAYLVTSNANRNAGM
jgi:hypothetical protein